MTTSDDRAYKNIEETLGVLGRSGARFLQHPKNGTLYLAQIEGKSVGIVTFEENSGEIDKIKVFYGSTYDQIRHAARFGRQCHLRGYSVEDKPSLEETIDRLEDVEVNRPAKLILKRNLVDTLRARDEVASSGVKPRLY